MNEDKRCPPARALTCLGITIDLDANSISIESTKLEEIYIECLKVRGKITISKKQFQSLLGKLIYLHKCIKPARIFINRILTAFRDNPHTKRIKLSKEFFQDIDWFLTFLPHFSGSTKIFKTPIVHAHSLHIDACTTGVGGIWNERVYAAPLLTFTDFQPGIVHLEMLNILLALRIWAKFWTSSLVIFYCDNMAVVHVIESGKTRDKFLNACIRNIWLITATHDIELHMRHIEGKRNTMADALSRIYSKSPICNNIMSFLKESCTWELVPVHYFNLSI